MKTLRRSFYSTCLQHSTPLTTTIYCAPPAVIWVHQLHSAVVLVFVNWADAVRSTRLNKINHSRLSLWCSLGVSKGPILFMLFKAKLVELVTKHSLQFHLCVDETQIICRCSLFNENILAQLVSACLNEFTS
jgi:hypothetical protein